MIRCNLAVLLAERGLKMADIINDTTLSKTAVRSLYYNTSKGIQFNTLEMLCDYLGVDVADLLERAKFDISIEKITEQESESHEIIVKVESDEDSFSEIVEVKNTTSKIFEFNISRKFFNTLRTLPESKRTSFFEYTVITPFIEHLKLEIGETSFNVNVLEIGSNEYATWFGSELF